MYEITLERNAVCKKALDDWANADLSSKQANCAVALGSIVNEIGILAITTKGRTGSEGLNLHGDVTKQILASQSKRGNDVKRATLSRVWNEHLTPAYELDPKGTVLLFDPAEVAQIVAEFRNGTRRLKNKPKPKPPVPSRNPDKVFTFINEVAKPMTKAKAVKSIKRIMGACGVSLSDLR